MSISVRRACTEDLARVSVVRRGITDNRLTDSSKVSEAEVSRYLENAIFLVSDDEDGVQGFICANPLNAFIWALFVIDGQHGAGHGRGLIAEVERQLVERGHRQVYLTTGPGARAVEWYMRRGCRVMGTGFGGDLALVKGACAASLTLWPYSTAMRSSRISRLGP